MTKFMFVIVGFELQGTVEEVENLKKEVDNLKHCGETKWQEIKTNVNTFAKYW